MKTQEEIKDLVDKIQEHALTQFGVVINNDVIIRRVEKLIEYLTDALIDNRITHMNLQDANSMLAYLKVPFVVDLSKYSNIILTSSKTYDLAEKKEDGRPTVSGITESNDPVNGQRRKAGRPGKTKAPSSTL